MSPRVVSKTEQRRWERRAAFKRWVLNLSLVDMLSLAVASIALVASLGGAA